MTESVEFCTRCVISNQRPLASREYARSDAFAGVGRMAFDADGVCAACRVAERKLTTDWDAREAELIGLLTPYRRHGNGYDVICPGSGGKDSVYAAHLLRDRFGMHPLTVTWAPHRYTAVGWRNFQAWLAAGFDNVLVTPNPRVHGLLTRLALVNLGHPFQPFILGQRTLARTLAWQHGIGLVVFGEDDEEYEGVPGWQTKDEGTADPTTLRLGGVPYLDLLREYGLTAADLEWYVPRIAPQVRTIALGRYVPWQPQAAYYFAAKHGFEANDQRTEGTYSKYNSIDDELDGLHYYLTWIKFGLGRASYDAAQEIRNGHLTRAEGVALVRRFDGEFPARYHSQCLEYMGMTAGEFRTVIARLRAARPELWDGDRLRHQVR